MRVFLFLIVATCLVCAAVADAMQASDKEAIVKAALDYAEGWYEGDADRMATCLHPELAKRVMKMNRETGEGKLESMGKETLVEYTKAGYGKSTPKEKQLKEVTVLDVFGNAASAKIEMSDWIDYLHLAKSNGKWVIVNVLWEMKPRAE
ncbi:MAG: nuclear transport factor 2 family protein [Candidatus Latescibacterota bacterium]|nr:MAG: nuclear transport factor 2 family protein [Candidatus Latescibacterota bacterium]